MASQAYNPEIMKVFGFWAGALALKLLAMSILTARQRFRKKVFANHEDCLFLKKARVTFDDEDVERVRRSHLNDLENVLPWTVITWLWLGTNPPMFIAANAIRLFVVARMIHTLSYAIYPKQPFRVLSFAVGMGITAAQAAYTMYYYF